MGEPRQVDDLRAMRALAHPLRLAMLEYLAMRGTLTTGEAAEVFAESPEACEFHLRALEENGYVQSDPPQSTGHPESAGSPEGGTPGAPERRWRLAHIGMQVGLVQESEELTRASDMVSRLLVRRWMARIQDHLETRHCYPPEWRAATGWTGYIAYLTLDEAGEFTRELAELLNRYRGRLRDPSARPPGARPVEVMGFTFPIDPDRPVV